MKALHKLLLGIIFTFSAFSTYALETMQETASFETFTNTEKGYTLDYPSNWKRSDVPQLDLVLFAPSNDKDEKPHASMNIVSEKVGTTISLDQFYSESTSNLTSALKEVEVQKTGISTFNKTPGKWIIYTHVMQGIKFRVLQYFIVAQDTIYLVTFSTPTDEFEQYRPIFEKIAHSFKLLNN